MLNLATLFDASAREYPDKTAIVFRDARFTYRQVGAMVNRIANGLASSGIGRGDKVALSCPNLPYFPMAYYAILKAGATVVPLNVLLKAREIAYHLNDCEARAYLCFQGTPELPMAQEGYEGFKAADGCERMWIITADPAAPSPIKGIETLGQMAGAQPDEFDIVSTNPDDTAVILYTSGTTGLSKGAELSHSNMTLNALCSRDLLELTPDDVLLVVLPLFHSFGQTVLMNTGMVAGASLVMIPRFTPDGVLRAMQAEGVTVFAGVPTMYWAS
jgi:long-chain acyl-CoA synthetase